MTPDWYEDLAERLIEAAEHADVMVQAGGGAAFRVAATAALDMAASEQDELDVIWHEMHGTHG